MFAAALLLLYDSEVEIPSKRLGLRKVCGLGTRRDDFSGHSSIFSCLRDSPGTLLQFSSEIHLRLSFTSFTLNNRAS
jgi:hypothetical protein